MTPSEAHESAWQRSPEHDEMTIACRDIIEAIWRTYNWTIKYDQEREHNLAGVWCENFMESERRGWFADILVRWTCNYETERKDKKQHNIYGIFEIKPKLYSAGAIMRQKAVQESRLRSWIKGQSANTYGISDWDFGCFVDVIATEQDPLVETYIRLSRGSILLWDGKQRISRRRYEKQS